MAKRIRLLLMTLICVIVAATIGFAACEPDVPESESYTVTYARGADDATGDIPDSETYAEGDTVTLASSATFTRDGYLFTAWSDGEGTYAAGASYTMPAHDVTFTALWEAVSTPGGDDEEEDEPPVGGDDEEEDDVLTTSELSAEFYDASNWEYMTNNDGAELDIGDVAYSLSDGSIKFHRANQAIDYGDQTNAHMSFMLKGTNDWNIWFNSSSADNSNNYSYRLQYAYSGLRISISSNPEAAAALIDDSNYQKAEWNRFDIIFSTEDGVTSIKVYVNGERATLTAGDNTQNVTVADNVMYHTMPSRFKTGSYIVVKVWDADDYVQLKPVANADVEDVPVIAAIGASITEGAGASNFYTESYPAQLQNSLGRDYNVINFGKSGRTVRTDLTDDSDSDPIPWLYNLQAEGVKAIVPDIAIINMGTNDSKTSNDPATTYENFYETYSYLVDWLLEINPDMRIIVCTVPYAYSSIYNINNDNIRDIIAPVQRQIVTDYVAKGYNFELVDLYEITQNKSLLFGDGVHPGTRGYAMFAEVFTKVLLEGSDALTEEFLADIDARYNDPEYEIADIHAELEVVDDEVILTVSGYIEFEDQSYLRLVVETGTDGDEREQSFTLEDDGTFTVSMRIDDLQGTAWYNVRIYLNENFYYFVRLAETDLSSGNTFDTSSRRVTVQSWSSGGEATFSFSVTDYAGYTIELDSAEIDTSDGIVLRITGTVFNTDDIQLYVGVHPTQDGKWREYVDITVNADGTFTVEYDLASIPVTGEWVNVRIYYPDGTYFVVPLASTTSGGQAVSSGDVFYGESTKLTVQSWSDGGVGTLSLSVVEYTNYVQATDVRFEDGYLVFSGVASDLVEELEVYLYNATEDIKTYSATAEIGADGQFTVNIELSQLTMADGNWYYLWVSVNGGDLQKVEFSGYDSDQRYGYGLRVYYWAYWEGIAVVYNSYSYSITNAEIQDSDGVATLVVEGYLEDDSVLAEDLTLWLDNTTDGQTFTVENQAAEAGTFKFTFDISSLNSGAAYYLRLYNGETKIADINSAWAADILFEEVEIGTDTVYYFYRNSLTAYYTLGIVRVDNSVPAPVVTITNVSFEDGYLVVSGTTENTEELKVALSSSDTDTIAVTASLDDGSFSVSIDLSLLTASAGEWYRLKVSANGSEWANVPYYEGFDTEQFYMFGARRYYFTVEWSNTDFALVYASYSYSITNVEICDEDGVATLVVEGYLVDESIAAENIKLILNKTSGTAETITIDNELSDAGKFRFTYDISGLESEQPYFLRLYNGETKIDDINSRWAADILFEEVEIGTDNVYYFYRNSLTAYYTLGVVRVNNSVPSPVVTVTDVTFEDGYLVVTGAAENLEALYVYLINNNVSGSLENYVVAEISEGVFTAKLSLDTIASFGQGSSIPFNLRYKIDDLSSSTINVEQGTLDITQVYEYNGYLYKLGINGSCVALYCSEATAQVIATYVGFEDDCLVVKGTVIATDNIVVHINNSIINFDYIVEDIEIAEDGTFELKISLDAFEDAAAAEYLNIRVSIDGSSSLTGVTQNNVDLSQTYTYGDREYKLGLNGTTVYVRYTA